MTLRPAAARLDLSIAEHLHRRLARAEALVVLVFLRIVSSLIEAAALLAADDDRDRALADGDLRVNLVRADEIDLAGADEHVARLFDHSVVGLAAVVEAIVALDALVPVEHAVERIDVSVVVDARASAVSLPGLALGEPVDREAEVRVFVEKQILGAAVSRDAVGPMFRSRLHFGIGEQLGERRRELRPTLFRIALAREQRARFLDEALKRVLLLYFHDGFHDRLLSLQRLRFLPFRKTPRNCPREFCACPRRRAAA